MKTNSKSHMIRTLLYSDAHRRFEETVALDLEEVGVMLKFFSYFDNTHSATIVTFLMPFL
jgi:hypothetical protein